MVQNKFYMEEEQEISETRSTWHLVRGECNSWLAIWMAPQSSLVLLVDYPLLTRNSDWTCITPPSKLSAPLFSAYFSTLRHLSAVWWFLPQIVTLLWLIKSVQHLNGCTYVIWDWSVYWSIFVFMLTSFFVGNRHRISSSIAHCRIAS